MNPTVKTATDLARANGVAVATVRKRGQLLGGHKVFGRWRFPTVEIKQPNGAVTQPARTLRELAEELSNLAAIAKARDNRINARIEEIERRLIALEGRP